MKTFLFQGLAAAILALQVCHADVVPASLFTSHAVLQHGDPVPVWGKADPGEGVEVSFLDQKHTATAGDDGRWMITLSPMKPGQTGTLTITGRNTVRLEDVVTGEVWLCSGQEIRGREIAISFDHAENGLVSRGEKLKGFAIAGEDRKWHWADARIEGRQIIVSSPEVAKPVAVRYAWASNPEFSVFAADRLPASPFRTDDFPIQLRQRSSHGEAEEE